MVKLNQNYSDYTDETDENYPEGKAINASSSESVDGTPLLAEFMNDINAAHIAMYKKAYGSTDGISGIADTQIESQFADAVVKYTDDKVKNHADQRGLSDGVHGATSEVMPGQIASRDEFGNIAVGEAIKDADAVNKGMVKAMIKVVADAVTPVGFVYTQYPGCPSPTDLHLFGTWKEIKFGGAFFRSEGGNAKAYTEPFACTVSGDGLNITFTNKPTASQLSVGDILIFNDQYREVKSYNANTGVAIVTTAFNTPSEITTVIIGQDSTNKSHSHSITDPGHYHITNFSQNNESGTYRYLSNSGGNNANRPINSNSVKTGITINSTGNNESRSMNISIKVWRRIN